MKSIELKASLRKELGKKSTVAIRKQGNVPCVMYGGEENIHFSASANEFRHIIFTNQVYVVKLDLDGKIYQAILKEAQYHPVTDELLHMDFIQVSDDKPAVVSLPIAMTGNSVGIREGGKLRQRRRYLKVKGLIKDLPEELLIDISDLKIGDFVKVEDLDYTNMELLDPAKAMILGVSASRLSKGMEEGELEGAEEAAKGEEVTEEGGEATATAESSDE